MPNFKIGKNSGRSAKPPDCDPHSRKQIDHMAWNTETDELIKKLWADGRSASQIGAEIGVSRNAIIGRVHRLGLSGRSVPAKQSRNEDDARLEQEVTRLFKEAKFKIISGATFRRMTGDIVVEHPLLGRKRRYAIEFVAQATDKQINERAARFENYVRQSKRPFAEFDEFWLVTDKFTGDIDYTMPHIPRQFRAFDLEGLKAVLAQDRPPKQKPTDRTARTKIGRSIEKNEKEIDLAIAGLLLQLDDKLTGLRNERPNSDDAIKSRDARISDYERMRAELEHIREMMTQFKTGMVKEVKVVQSVNTFADGIKSWWKTNHAAICTRTFDLGLFASSVAICSLAGASGNLAAAVSAALVGGKSVAGALKGIGKKIID